MEAGDRIRLRHMMDAADDVARFLVGRERADLDSDRMLLFAVVRALEIIGAAASKVSQETRGVLPAIPWRAIVGMRNRVVHAYFDIDRDIVWKAATEEVPALRASIGAVVDAGVGNGD